MKWISCDVAPKKSGIYLVIQRYKAGTYGNNDEVSCPFLKLRFFRQKDKWGIKKSGNIEVLYWTKILGCPKDVKHREYFGL